MIKRLFIVLLTALLISLPVCAADEWNEGIYRAYSEEGQLTQEEIDSLDEIACSFVKKYDIDMVLVVTDSEGYEGELEDAADRFYENNDFGYGENRDGILACYDEDSDRLVIRTFGEASEKFPQSFIDENEDYLPKFHINHGNYGVPCAFALVADDYLSGGTSDSEETEDTVALEAGNAGNEAETEAEEKTGIPDFERDEYGLPLRNTAEDKPSWFPEDPDSFEFYHDSEVSRVIDKADIFSVREEKEMAERIAEITEDTGKDVVIYTDNSTYGSDRHKYTYDFYDFCGYGIGDTYDGMCLFICMDPDNRGWVASATGVVEDMYTEPIANEMDDELFPYMKEKRYGEGVLNWIENLNNLYTTGYPFVAEWLPSDRDSYERKENPDVTRFYDSADVYDEKEEELFTPLLKRITDKYGVDAVIHTTRHTYGMSDEEYADAFYYYNGYGYGKDFDGILLTIFAGEKNRCLINAYGSVKNKMTAVNHDRMIKKIESDLEGDYYYLGGYSFVKDVDHMEKTGRVSHSFGGWLLRLILAAVAGVAVGGISLLKASSKMKTVRAAFNADDYLNGIQNIIPVCDNFIDETVSRTKIVKPTYSSSSSSGSSHSSSYHSHSSGSSGRSHTSSGRSF